MTPEKALLMQLDDALKQACQIFYLYNTQEKTKTYGGKTYELTDQISDFRALISKDINKINNN